MSADTHYCDEECTGYAGGVSGWRDNEPGHVFPERYFEDGEAGDE